MIPCAVCVVHSFVFLRVSQQHRSNRGPIPDWFLGSLADSQPNLLPRCLGFFSNYSFRTRGKLKLTEIVKSTSIPPLPVYPPPRPDKSRCKPASTIESVNQGSPLKCIQLSLKARQIMTNRLLTPGATEFWYGREENEGKHQHVCVSEERNHLVDAPNWAETRRRMVCPNYMPGFQCPDRRDLLRDATTKTEAWRSTREEIHPQTDGNAGGETKRDCVAIERRSLFRETASH